MYTNADSLLNKKDELLTRMKSIKPSIVGITETKAKNEVYKPVEAEYEIRGYYYVCK